jgi:hypothetical protein
MVKNYVWCSCESFDCKNNPDSTGRKVQEAQTTARHQQADNQLRAAATHEQPPAQQEIDPGLVVAEEFFDDFPPGEPQSRLPSLPGSPNGSIAHSPAPPARYPDLGDLLDQGLQDFEDHPAEFSDKDEGVFRPFGDQVDEEDLANDGADVDTVEEDNEQAADGADDPQIVNDLLEHVAGVSFDYSDTRDDVAIHTAPPLCMEDHPVV